MPLQRVSRCFKFIHVAGKPMCGNSNITIRFIKWLIPMVANASVLKMILIAGHIWCFPTHFWSSRMGCAATRPCAVVYDYFIEGVWEVKAVRITDEIQSWGWFRVIAYWLEALIRITLVGKERFNRKKTKQTENVVFPMVLFYSFPHLSV